MMRGTCLLPSTDTTRVRRFFYCKCRCPDSGYSLVELLMVVLIMSVMAGIAVQTTEAARQVAVDAAANEIIQTLQFAQNEALRTSSPRVVAFDASNKLVRVYQLIYGASAPVEDTARPVLHPVDKTAYKVQLDRLTFSPVQISLDASFSFSGGAALATIAFDATGNPVSLIGPNASDTLPLAASVKPQITIASGGISRSIQVDAATGRIRS